MLDNSIDFTSLELDFDFDFELDNVDTPPNSIGLGGGQNSISGMAGGGAGGMNQMGGGGMGNNIAVGNGGPGQGGSGPLSRTNSVVRIFYNNIL